MSQRTLEEEKAQGRISAIFERLHADLQARNLVMQGLADALSRGIDEVEDGLHQEPCHLEDCWIDKARAALLAAAPYLEDK